jgi:lysophospholipase
VGAGASAPLIGVPQAPVPKDGAAGWIEGAGGVQLRAALFPATGAPRGSVVLSGGRTEPIEKYFEVIEELRARGFCVLAHDWRGQGLSARLLKDPRLGHATRPGDFVADFQALLAAYEPQLPKPWVAFAHSMGASLVALALAAGERRFAAAVLTAPMFGILTGAVPVPLAKLLAGLANRLGAGGAMAPGLRYDPLDLSFEGNILTHDRRRFERFQAQLAACPELALGPPTWGWLNFAFEAMDGLERCLAAIETPLLMLAAGDERLVDPAAIRRFAARLPTGRLVEVAGALHEVLQETDEIRNVVWREFDAFVGSVI